MAMYAWHQRPAIDCLMNQYREDTHAQFGNVRMVKELSSVANQLGMKRTLCETYGAGGWDLRFEDMKRIGDWLAVLGVNTIDQHLSYVTIRGARKRDHPQSFSYHEPWWEAYHVSADYFARLSAALSQGEQINRVLVIEPTTTAWMYQGDGARLSQIGDSFFKLLMSLEAAQIEYDIGCEDILARSGVVKGSELRVGKRSYVTVVIPPDTENLNAHTVGLLRQFGVGGGSLLECGLPERVRIDGALPMGLDGLTPLSLPWKKIQDLAPTLRQAASADGFLISRVPDDKGILFHQRRHLDDGQLLFLVNTSIGQPSAGTVTCDLAGVESWNPHTGKREPYPFENNGGRVRADFRLPPSGSLLLFLSSKNIKAGPAEPGTAQTLTASGPIEIRRLEPNVLTLDYMDITAGGETKSNLYFYAANKFAFQKNGLDRNPWDSGVQFRDNLITKKFPAGTGFSASYRFHIEERVPAGLAIVIERPDLYTITCNGQAVCPVKGEWWLDKSFGRISIGKQARIGENVVAITASPFTIYHELESAYVLGEFRLKSTEHGFAIVPDGGLEPGKWNEQGSPFYSAGVAYRQGFKVEEAKGRFVVSVPSWYGSVARVTVNQKPAGYIGWAPWECDVSKFIKRGDNTIEVAVIGTLKNTLGPHHGKPALGAAWPGQFQTGPSPGPPAGSEYSTVGYGLFAPFELKQLAR
jgi:hypothetical protein